MTKTGWIRAICLFTFLHGMRGWICAYEIQDPSTDFAFLEIEPYASFNGDRFSGPLMADKPEQRPWRIAGQVSFPAGKIRNHQFFGSLKTTLMEYDIVYHDSLRLNDGRLKRFCLSGGDSWSGAEGRSSLVLVSVGVSSDFSDPSPKDYNSEWIYSRFWTPSPVFNWGIGLDIQQYFDTFAPYPLLFVEWRVGDRTKLKWDADYFEARRFLNPRLCLTAGVRYNLEFFALKDDADFEYDSIGLETGFQYAVGADCYVRVKYKELVWGSQTLGLPDGSHHTNGIDGGRSLRLNFAYGI
jgi:hypothetical protein